MKRKFLVLRGSVLESFGYSQENCAFAIAVVDEKLDSSNETEKLDSSNGTKKLFPMNEGEGEHERAVCRKLLQEQRYADRAKMNSKKN